MRWRKKGVSRETWCHFPREQQGEMASRQFNKQWFVLSTPAATLYDTRSTHSKCMLTLKGEFVPAIWPVREITFKVLPLDVFRLVATQILIFSS